MNENIKCRLKKRDSRGKFQFKVECNLFTHMEKVEISVLFYWKFIKSPRFEHTKKPNSKLKSINFGLI